MITIPRIDLDKPKLPDIGKISIPTYQPDTPLEINTDVSLGDRANYYAQTSIGKVVGAGVAGIFDGFVQNQSIRSTNNAISGSIQSLEKRIDERKKDRKESKEYRRGEAKDFLLRYATINDPNRSSQVAQMYTTGQDRYRAEQNSIDSSIDKLSSNISQLESQKQDELDGLDILGIGIGSAVSSLPFL